MSKNIAVNILDREFMVACSEESQPQLERSAVFLDQKMQEIKASGKVFGVERIAIMAALNLTHELLSYQDNTQPEDNATLSRIEKKLALVLDDEQEEGGVQTGFNL